MRRLLPCVNQDLGRGSLELPSELPTGRVWPEWSEQRCAPTSVLYSPPYLTEMEHQPLGGASPVFLPTAVVLLPMVILLNHI